MAGDRTKTLLGVVHCSATPPSMDIGAAEINRWHYSKGIRSPRGPTGYHGVIRRNGVLELGRETLEIGAHAFGHNAVSVSVCLVGGIDESGDDDPRLGPQWDRRPEDNFTTDQWDTLKRVLDYWRAVWPGIVLAGHRDLGAPKACPSFDVHQWLVVHYSDDFAIENKRRLREYLAAYRKERDR